MKNQQKVAIIGGGITGLSAAFYLQQKAREEKRDLSITLFEADHRLGGKIQTIRQDGFVMERGPDSFLERKASAKQLAIDLGLEDQLVRNQTGQAFILKSGSLLPIPEGAVMGVPTRLAPFAFTPLFSLKGKIRAAGDLVLPRLSYDQDISVGSFFRKRLGDEVVEGLIEPLLSGIYAGNLDELSLAATFPQFVQMEKEHRSLVLATRRSRPSNQGTGSKKGMFLTLKHGLADFVEALEKQLSAVTIRTGTHVNGIKPLESGFRICTDSGQDWEVDSVVLTLPHSVTRRVLPEHPALVGPKESDHATSVATVIMAYEKQAIKQDIEGTGYLIPRREDTTITACTWTHKKWPHTTPDGKALIRCYVGRAGDDSIVDEEDETIISKVRKDLKTISRIEDEPVYTQVSRWKQAMPQYGIGHATWMEHMEKEIQNQWPGLFFAGASYRGIGIPDCIDQGKQAVESVWRFIQTKL